MRILLLSAALLIAASDAAAVTIDLDNPNGIAALYVSEPYTNAFVVCTDGTGFRWSVGSRENGRWDPFQPSPVPLSEVADWTPLVLYTFDGRWYGRADPTEVWLQMGVDSGIASVFPRDPVTGPQSGKCKGTLSLTKIAAALPLPPLARRQRQVTARRSGEHNGTRTYPQLGAK